MNGAFGCASGCGNGGIGNGLDEGSGPFFVGFPGRLVWPGDNVEPAFAPFVLSAPAVGVVAGVAAGVPKMWSA